MYSSPEEATTAGQKDPYCKALGGFSVYDLGGVYDFFPHGDKPDLNTYPVAVRVVQCDYKGGTWECRQLNPSEQ